MLPMNQGEFAARHDVSRKTVRQRERLGWLVFQGDWVDVNAFD